MKNGITSLISDKGSIMEQSEIQARIGTEVTEVEMVDMMRSQPIGTSQNDVRVRSGVLSFSFGPHGAVLTGAEQRKPLASTTKVG